MTQRWRKLGRIFGAAGKADWLHSHAANPVAEHLHGNRFRVYFSSRDAQKRSYIGWLILEIEGETARVAEVASQPVLPLGERGMFDDSGMTVTGVVRRGQQRLLHYLGWNLAVTIPFRNAIGVAVAEGDGVDFTRASVAPAVDRSDVDPISLSYPFLLWDGDRFRIWYGSCISWNGPTVADYQFSLKYAESQDGVHWTRRGNVVLPCRHPEEDAIARPHVLREHGLYKMWYSRKKGPQYRMGYAESPDGLQWQRRDDAVGIDVSPSGWDSEMVEYPFVFDHGGRRYMLYNGNGYGATGFGLAVLTPD
jgi:hypothetical protein